jgi:hypothetical protein
MKNDLFIFLLLLFFSAKGLSQDSASPKKQHKLPAVYFALNGGEANGKFIIGFGTSFIIKNGWGISFGLKEVVYKAKLLPNDYYPGWDILGDDPIPQDHNFFYTLTSVKEFNHNWKGIVPGIETGITYLVFAYYSNFQSIPDDYGLFGGSSNYTAAYKKKYALGLSVKPKLKFILSKNIGLETSVWTILNKIENQYGVEVNLLIGRLK